MRLRSVLETAAVLSACLASGDLECEHPRMTVAEHRGQEVYARMCGICHGRTGQGYAADRAPALANRAFLASVTDDYLRDAIADGRRGTTMSAWSRARGGPLAATDLDAVVTFLRSWAPGERAALDERPVHGDPGHGAEEFATHCVGCHGARGTGGPQVHVGNPQLLARATDGFLRYAIGRGRTGTPMPGFDDKLGRAGIDDVLALLRRWQESGTGAMPPARIAPISLGALPLNAQGPEPTGFVAHPGLTKVDAVKAQLDRGARLGLLDARAPSDYLTEHIAGAVSVPFYDPEPYLAQLPKDVWLVCYCACPHAESGQLARKLASSGFAKVTVLDEGFIVWKTRGYPTHGGSEP